MAIPLWKKVAGLAGLACISTVGCDPAKAQDELPKNPDVCFDHPTTNEDGTPLTDLLKFRIRFYPLDGQNSYWFHFSDGDFQGVRPDADENGRQCVSWSGSEDGDGLFTNISRVEQREGKALYGAWRLELYSQDTSGNTSGRPVGDTVPFPNPEVRFSYVAQVEDSVAPRAPINFRVPE